MDNGIAVETPKRTCPYGPAQTEYCACKFTFGPWESPCPANGVTSRDVVVRDPPGCIGVPNVWHYCTPGAVVPQQPAPEPAVITCRTAIVYQAETPNEAQIIEPGFACDEFSLAVALSAAATKVLSAIRR